MEQLMPELLYCLGTWNIALLHLKNETKAFMFGDERPINRNQISLIKFHAYKITDKMKYI
jgi:hypothetical protein